MCSISGCHSCFDVAELHQYARRHVPDDCNFRVSCFCTLLTEIWKCRQILAKLLNIKFLLLPYKCIFQYRLYCCPYKSALLLAVSLTHSFLNHQLLLLAVSLTHSFLNHQLLLTVSWHTVALITSFCWITEIQRLQWNKLWDVNSLVLLIRSWINFISYRNNHLYLRHADRCTHFKRTTN